MNPIFAPFGLSWTSSSLDPHIGTASTTSYLLNVIDILENDHFLMLTSVSMRPPKGTISAFSEPPNMFLSAPKLLDVDLSGYNFSVMVLPWDQVQDSSHNF